MGQQKVWRAREGKESRLTGFRRSGNHGARGSPSASKLAGTAPLISGKFADFNRGR